MFLSNRMIYQRATLRRMKRGEHLHYIKEADCGATKSRSPYGDVAGVVCLSWLAAQACISQVHVAAAWNSCPCESTVTLQPAKLVRPHTH